MMHHHQSSSIGDPSLLQLPWHEPMIVRALGGGRQQVVTVLPHIEGGGGLWALHHSLHGRGEGPSCLFLTLHVGAIRIEPCDPWHQNGAGAGRGC